MVDGSVGKAVIALFSQASVTKPGGKPGRVVMEL